MAWLIIIEVSKTFCLLQKRTGFDTHHTIVVEVFYKVPINIFLNSNKFAIIHLLFKVKFPYWSARPNSIRSSFCIFSANWSAKFLVRVCICTTFYVCISTVWPVSFITFNASGRYFFTTHVEPVKRAFWIVALWTSSWKLRSSKQ